MRWKCDTQDVIDAEKAVGSKAGGAKHTRLRVAPGGKKCSTVALCVRLARGGRKISLDRDELAPYIIYIPRATETAYSKKDKR